MVIRCRRTKSKGRGQVPPSRLALQSRMILDPSLECGARMLEEPLSGDDDPSSCNVDDPPRSCALRMDIRGHISVGRGIPSNQLQRRHSLLESEERTQEEPCTGINTPSRNNANPSQSGWIKEVKAVTSFNNVVEQLKDIMII